MARKRYRRPLYGYLFFDKLLPKKDEVLRISAATGLSRREVAMTLLEFWSWVDDNSPDGLLARHNVRTLSLLIDETTPEFWREVINVGWLSETSEGIEVPNFDRWMGRTAKRRAQDAWKKRNRRHSLPENGDTKGTTRGTRRGQQGDNKGDTCQNVSENKDDDKGKAKAKAKAKAILIPPIPPELDSVEFRAAWDQWVVHRQQIGKKLTTAAMQAQFSRLVGMGRERAVAAIEFSMAQGWVGIFEQKGGGGGSGASVGSGARVRAEAGKYDAVPLITCGEEAQAQGGTEPAAPDPPAPDAG